MPYLWVAKIAYWMSIFEKQKDISEQKHKSNALKG
jgi:hypothetical protein